MLWKTTTSVGNFEFGYGGGGDGKEKNAYLYYNSFICNDPKKLLDVGILGEILIALILLWH